MRLAHVFKGRSAVDTWLNLTLALVFCACVLVYMLPIFSNQLYTSQDTHNFGAVKSGTEIRHQFTLRNLHPWSVTVTGVHSDCGCTRSIVGQVPPFQLAPLQAITVSTVLTTRGKTGHISQNVLVITGDNSNGTLLRLRGEVQGNGEINGYSD